MGLFGDDSRQDERLDAMERHLRMLTETVMDNQVDLTAAWIAILALQAEIDEKVTAEEVDPAIGELNQKLKTAREELEKASTAAAESWATLQDGANRSMETLRTSVREAKDRIQKG